MEKRKIPCRLFRNAKKIERISNGYEATENNGKSNLNIELIRAS